MNLDENETNLTQDNMCTFDISFLLAWWTVEQTIGRLVIWDVMWRHFNDIIQLFPINMTSCDERH